MWCLRLKDGERERERERDFEDRSSGLILVSMRPNSVDDVVKIL